MRRICLATAIMLFSLIPFASYGANGVDGFEDGDWNFSAPNANGTAEISSTVFHSGSKSLRINVTTAAPDAPWNIFGNKAGFGSVTIGKKYKLKFWSKSDVNYQEIRFGFNLAGTQNELNSDYSSQQSGYVWTRDWEQHDLTFTASRTANVDIYILGAKMLGEVYLDDLSLEEQPMGVNDPGFESQQWWLGGSPTNNTYTNSVGSFTYDNTVSHTGTWSLKINTFNSGAAWDLMAVCGGVYLEIGKKYKVSYWARGDGDGDARQLTIGLGDGLSFPIIEDATTWKEYSFSFDCTSQDGARDFGFQAGGNNGIIWVDDINVSEIIPEPFLRYGYEANNILPVNSGFEIPTGNVFTTLAGGGSGATFVIDDTDSYESKKSLKVNVTSLPSSFWDVQVFTNKMTTVVNHNYVVSFWAKADNGQKIDVKISDGSNNTWSNGEKQFTLTDQWKRYFLETNSNVSGTNSALLTFMFGRATGDYWLDNIVVADMDTLNNNTNLPELLNTDYSTQLVNGNFEVNGSEGWTFTSDASLVSVDAKNGFNAVRIIPAVPSVLVYYANIKQTNITLAAFKPYTVSFWAKANNFIYLKSEVNSNGMPLNSEFMARLTKDWKRYEYTFSAPPYWNINTDKATLLFGASYQLGTYDIDDVILTNSETFADHGISTALVNASSNGLKFVASAESIQVYGDTFSKYELVNLSGQLIASGQLQAGKAQFKTALNNGMYIAKFTKLNGANVTTKLLVQ